MGDACGSSAVGIAAAGCSRRRETRSGRPATAPARPCSTFCRTAPSPRTGPPLPMPRCSTPLPALGRSAWRRCRAAPPKRSSSNASATRWRLCAAISRALGETARARIIPGDATRPPRAAVSCAVAFLDPPYRSGLAGPALSRARRGGLADPRRARRDRDRCTRGDAAGRRVHACSTTGPTALRGSSSCAASASNTRHTSCFCISKSSSIKAWTASSMPESAAKPSASARGAANAIGQPETICWIAGSGSQRIRA